MTKAAGPPNMLSMEWSLLLIAASLYASFAMTENAKSTRLKKSDRDVLICADTEPTGSDSVAVILWDTTSPSNCSLAYTGVLNLVPFNVTGYRLTELDPKMQYNITVTCRSGNIARWGQVALRTGTHYSSKECTSADWLTKGEGAGTNVTMCLDPHISAVTFNATSPLEDCYLFEGKPGKRVTQKHIHLLPYTSTNQVPTPGTTYSINCTPPSSMVFQSDLLTFTQDLTKTVCYTKALEARSFPMSTQDPSGPDINKVRPSFTSGHVGIFVVLLIATLVVITSLTYIVIKRIRLQHRRQGARLLVEEDPTEAAFRDLQEMEM